MCYWGQGQVRVKSGTLQGEEWEGWAGPLCSPGKGCGHLGGLGKSLRITEPLILCESIPLVPCRSKAGCTASIF